MQMSVVIHELVSITILYSGTYEPMRKHAYIQELKDRFARNTVCGMSAHTNI